MRNYLLRRFNAFGLLISLLIGAVSPTLFSASVFAQENQEAKQESKKQKKSKETENDKSVQTPVSTVSKNARRPLAVNEDPSQIGKRNINKGFVGWLGGSKEKEVALGRQVAAEVE